MKDQIGEIVAEIRESAVCTELTKHPVSVELLHSWADKLEALGGQDRAPMELTDSEIEELGRVMESAWLKSTPSNQKQNVGNAFRQWLAERSGG